MKIAVAQTLSTNDVLANIEMVRENVERLAAEGARLVVFPEATMHAFGEGLAEATQEYAETWKRDIADIAVRYGVYLVAGGFAPAEDPGDERIANQLIAVTPEGETFYYTKIHLYDAYGYKESDTVAAGHFPLTIEVDGAVVGLATCYDIRFPKLYADYARAGAQVILTPSSWGGGVGKENQWKLLTATRALDSNSFVVAVDQADPRTVDPEADWTQPTGIGYSRVVNPFGEVVAELGDSVDAFVVELDLEETKKAAETLPVLVNAKLDY